MCLFRPTALEGPWRDLEGPHFDPKFDHFGPLLRVLEEVAARPRTSCLWAGGPAQSLANPCPGPQILVILTTFGPPVNLENDLILTILALKPHNLAICSVQIGPFWRQLA